MRQQYPVIRIIRSATSSFALIGDTMYSVANHSNEPEGYQRISTTSPSLSRSVVRRILRTNGAGRTRRYSFENTGDRLRIGCQRFEGPAITALIAWTASR